MTNLFNKLHNFFISVAIVRLQSKSVDFPQEDTKRINVRLHGKLSKQ